MLQDTHTQPDDIIMDDNTDEADLAERRKFVVFKDVPTSELPCRMFRKRDETIIGSFPSKDDALAFLAGVRMQTLNPIVSKRRKRYSR